MAEKIVLLGGNGYIGAAFQKFFKKQDIVFSSLSRKDVEYTHGDVLRDFLKTHKPSFLVNCAGYSGKPNVDACELHKAECLAANAVLPGVIRRVCEGLGLPWAHISSGCIYTGDHGCGMGFAENDAPNFSFRHNNCSFYSGTKALGEEVLDGASGCFVWRLRIPFNHEENPRNYLMKVMGYDCLLDARNSLSHLDEFVSACWQCWEKRVPFGVYNMTNPESITTREVVALVEKSAIGVSLKARGKTFRFFESEEDFMKKAAKTPRSNCVLDTRKLQSVGICMTPVRDAIERSLSQWGKCKI